MRVKGYGSRPLRSEGTLWTSRVARVASQAETAMMVRGLEQRLRRLSLASLQALVTEHREAEGPIRDAVLAEMQRRA